MSLTRKGFRWTDAVGVHSPDVVDELSGAIWQGAPAATHLLGRKIVFAPDFSWVIDWQNVTTNAFGTKRAAEADGMLVFGGQGFYPANINVTTAGAGTETVLVTGGRLILINDAADNDLICVTFHGGVGATSSMAGLPFAAVANSVIRCGIRAKITDATQADLLFGLAVATQDAVGSPPDGIYIRKDDGDTQPDLVLNGSSETAKAMTDESGAAVTVAANTYFEAGFVIHGTSFVEGYWNGKRTVQKTVTNLTTNPLCPILQIQNGEPVAKGLTIEKFVITQDIV